MLLTVFERMHRVWKLILAIGVLNAILGLAIFFPALSPDAMKRLVGIMILVSGIAFGGYIFSMGNGSKRLGDLLQFAMRLLVAIAILFQPFGDSVSFLTIIMIFFGLDAFLSLIEARRVRDSRSLFLPYLLIGLTSAAFCALLWLHHKGGDYTTLSMLLAVAFWIRAAVLIYVALKARKFKPREMPTMAV